MDRTPAAPASPKLQLLLLGRFEVRAPNGDEVTFSLRRARALLAYLLVERRTRHSRDQLATLLWGESQQQQARQSLRQLLSGLRKGLPEPVRSCLEIGGDAVGLDASRIASDVIEFETAAATGTAAGAEQAAALYRGSFLAGLDIETPAFSEWLLHHRERLQDMAVDCLSRILEQQVEDRKLDRAIVTGTRILAFDPLREATHRVLMEVYARQGQRSLAIRQYHRCAELLERELGVQPEPATMRLYTEVNRRERNQRPTPLPAMGMAPSLSDEHLAPILPHPGPALGQRTVDQELIGRELESAALREALAAAVDRGSAVVITGEAGIGKSRLIHSVLASPGVAVDALISGAAELEQRQPFGPWIELLRSGQLGEAVSSDASLLADYSLFERLRARTGRSGPLVIVFEDLQWLDPASLEVLIYLANRLSTVPIVLVVSAREEELTRAANARAFIDWLRQQRDTLRLSLAPMATAEIDALVARTSTRLGLPQPDEKVSAEIRRLSDGNPRVAEELVNRGRDAGGQGWRTPLSIPDKIAAAISARLEQLEPIARTAIDVAAVLGRACEIDTWQRLGAFDSTQAVHLLDLLAASHMIELQGNELRFRRERDRLTAYQRMLPAKRSQLHAQAVQLLRQRHAIDLRPHHLELLRHAEAANLHEDAAVHALGAMEFAMQQGDWDGARRLAEVARRAMHGMAAGPVRQDMLADIDLCLTRMPHLMDGPEALDPLIGRLKSHEQQTADTERRARLALSISMLLDQRGSRGDAILKARAAMRLMGNSSRHAPWTPGDRLLLRPQMLAGQFETGLERLVQSIEYSGRIGDRRNEAIVLGTLGLCHAVAGRFDDALQRCAAGRAVAEALGDHSTLCACIQFGAQALAWRHDAATAVIKFDEALSIARRCGDLLRQYLLLGHRGQALLLGGDGGAAAEALREALELGSRLRADFFRPYFSAWRAEALVAAGAIEEAIEEASTAARLATATNQPWAQSVALRALGVALLRAASAAPQEAERLLAAALAMQEGMQITIEVARTLILMSEAQLVRASGDAAQRSFDRGRLMFEQMGMDPPVAGTHAG